MPDQALHSRLLELSLSIDELSSLTTIPRERVEAILGGKEQSAEEQVLLRILSSDGAVKMARERIQSRQTVAAGVSGPRGKMNLARGERHDGVEGIPYGSGYTGKDGGPPS